MELWQYFGLFMLGAGAFTLSTLTGGGGAMLLIPALNFWFGPRITAPTMIIGNSIGRPVRLILFWKKIDWSLTMSFVPAALLGSWISAYFFSSLKLEYLQIIVGVFLISTIFQYRFGKKEVSFKVTKKGFIIVGFFTAMIGTLIGGVGPVLNPFYQNFGLKKEALIATKTANSFLVGLFQISGFWYFGNLDESILLYGITLGAGVAVGNYIGKKILGKISNTFFLRAMLVMMVISGILMIIKGFN